jgi:type IX secretion system PorP/SprF family membrane protein
MKRITAFLIGCNTLLGGLYAQDAHWSQSSSSLLVQNPAFTGSLNKFSLNANYRNQWNALNTSYNTYLLNGDIRLGGDEPQNVSFSAGGIFYSDVAGDGSYHTTNSGVTFSCLVKGNEHLRFGAGIGYNIIQNSARLNEFSWGTQFNGINYDPSLSSGEMSGTVSKWFSDINAGVSAVYQSKTGTLSSNQGTRLLFGYSMNHINRPEISLNGGTDRLAVKHVVFMSGVIGLKNKNVSLKPTAFYYRQGKLNEITAGTLVRFAIGERSQITGYKKGSGFCIGALYRVNDAIIPTIQVEKGDFVFGASYDINVSSLTPASHLRGGIEFSISFNSPSGFLYKNKAEREE